MKMLIWVLLAINASVSSATAVTSGTSETSSGEAALLYRARCATCHDTGVPRAPDRAALSRLSVDNVRFALTQGSMRTHAASLTSPQRDALVHFLSVSIPQQGSSARTDAQCPANGGPFAPSDKEPRWNGWGADVSQRRFQPDAMAKLSAAQVPRLKLKWAFGFENGARSYGQPAVIGGRVFVGTSNRKVYSLNAATGCTYWTFDTESPVRTAITVGSRDTAWAVYFGDQHANAYALDAESGKLLWKARVESHDAATITGAPTLLGSILYVPVSSSEETASLPPKYECCKFRGSVAALDAGSGKLLWTGYTIAAAPRPTRKNFAGTQLWGPAGAAVWSAPTLDVKRNRAYVTTGDDYTDPTSDSSDAFIAFDATTGKRLWSRQMTANDTYNFGCEIPGPPLNMNCPSKAGPDHDFASSAMLVDLPSGKRALIAGQKSGVVHAIDPDRDGAILWQKRVGVGGKSGGVQWGSAADSEHVYVAVSDVVQKQVRPGTPGSQKSLLFGAPLQLDTEKGGGLYALKLTTGETVWHTPHPGCSGKPSCSPAQSAAVTAISGVVFSGGLDGHLRAYSAKTGKIVWDVDTVREYQTVNGVKGNGGSLDGPGPVVVGGTLYVNSGYLYMGSIPGNMLLAFSVDGK